MRTLKIAVPAAIVMGGLFYASSSMYGTPAYAKKEKQACNTCHSKVESSKEAMQKNLTAAGTCYKEHDHSLATCEVPKK